MAHAREQPPGIYHVTSRGVDRRRIFDEDDTRLLYYRLLARTVKKRGILVHAWCLMGNHVHLVVETSEPGGLSPAFQYLNSTYARLYNENCGRTGYLFERPFFSERLKTERHALGTCRYVVLNPVRARMCGSAADYRWSSFRATTGLVSRPPFLTSSWVLGLFDEDADRGRVKYALFVAEGEQLLATRAMAERAMAAVRSEDMAVKDAA